MSQRQRYIGLPGAPGKRTGARTQAQQHAPGRGVGNQKAEQPVLYGVDRRRETREFSDRCLDQHRQQHGLDSQNDCYRNDARTYAKALLPKRQRLRKECVHGGSLAGSGAESPGTHREG